MSAHLKGAKDNGGIRDSTHEVRGESTIEPRTALGARNDKQSVEEAAVGCAPGAGGGGTLAQTRAYYLCVGCEKRRTGFRLSFGIGLHKGMRTR